MATFEPKPFGKYYLTDCIAIGGMAEIYKAKTFGVDGFEKVLAIKKILSHYSADKDFITMLTDEAKLVVNLSHANIVQVYDLGRVADDYFISMEFIDGIDLREIVERAKELGKPIPDDICIYILSEVCRGLDYAHNKKDANGNPLQIVHRDVSPQNILVSYEGGVKIVDFGIAKAAMNLSQTNIGTLKGKVTYMAPEQAFGKPIDGRTDLYSAGIVLYELLTQERLFMGESQMEVLKKIRNARITVDSINPKIPQNLRPIVAKALAYHVKDRYQSASDMQIDLTRALYSHYPEFTPRKLVEFLKQWFITTKSKSEDIQDEDPNKETILVSSSTDQVNLVHHEETNHIGSNAPELNNTIKPDDQIKKEQFLDFSNDEKENTEKTEKSNHSGEDQSELSIDEMLRQKKRSSMFRKLIWTFVFFLALSALWFAKDILIPVDPDPQPPTPTPQTLTPPVTPTTPDKTVTHTITINTTPTDAALEWDNVKQPGQSPFVIKDIASNSNHKFRIFKDGYGEISDILKITPQSPAQFEYSLDVKTYALQIKSEPVGALILINGTTTGLKTPTKIESLKPNVDYKIQLQLEGHKTFEKVVSNSSSEEQDLKAKLEALPKTILTLTSEPTGAQIWINGKDTGLMTPYTYENFKDPTAKVSLKLKGHDEATIELELKSNQVNTWNGKLVKIPEPVVAKNISVRITSNVSGSDVSINGVVKGKTPLNLDLPIGTHKIFVSKKDHTTASKSVTLKSNQKSPELYFKINPKTAPVATPTKPTPVPQPITKPVEPKTPQPTTPPVKETTSNVSSTGQLRVDSTPRGASVKINGSPRGVTPIVVGSLPKNTPLSVTVSKSGYQTWSTSVTLNRDKTEIKANLSP